MQQLLNLKANRKHLPKSSVRKGTAHCEMPELWVGIQGSINSHSHGRVSPGFQLIIASKRISSKLENTAFSKHYLPLQIVTTHSQQGILCVASPSPEQPHLSKTPGDYKIPFFKCPRSASKGLRRLRQINLPGKVHDLRAENSTCCL